jgi:CxxC motif-containing protein (DUF1111 family)
MKAKYKVIALAGFCIAASFAIAQTRTPRPGHPPAISSIKHPHPQPQFGDPIAGLTEQQALDFSLGQAQFNGKEGISDGLGPIFNAQSCNACHTQPLVNGVATSGGASAVTETRFGNAKGVFDLLHQACIDPSVQDLVPEDSTVVAHRKTTPLFGLGLIEAIPDATIKNNVHSPAVDGVTGRVAILTDSVTTSIIKNGQGTNSVGRFGWKCQEATLLAFSGDAYANEMGIANRIFPLDFPPHIPNGQSLLDAANQANGFPGSGPNPPLNQDPPEDPTQPEGPTNKDDVARFTDFMETLAQPPTLPLSQVALMGQQLFTQINCVACHTPSMQTGKSPIAALNFKNVPLYSDLLLHDMGSLGDGIAQAAARPNEIRTAPLWGLRARTPYLHDGRASSILEAITLHDGEASIIRDRFLALPTARQQAIIAFINSI